MALQPLKIEHHICNRLGYAQGTAVGQATALHALKRVLDRQPDPAMAVAVFALVLWAALVRFNAVDPLAGALLLPLASWAAFVATVAARARVSSNPEVLPT